MECMLRVLWSGRFVTAAARLGLQPLGRNGGPSMIRLLMWSWLLMLSWLLLFVVVVVVSSRDMKYRNMGSWDGHLAEMLLREGWNEDFGILYREELIGIRSALPTANNTKPVETSTLFE